MMAVGSRLSRDIGTLTSLILASSKCHRYLSNYQVARSKTTSSLAKKCDDPSTLDVYRDSSAPADDSPNDNLYLRILEMREPNSQELLYMHGPGSGNGERGASVPNVTAVPREDYFRVVVTKDHSRQMPDFYFQCA